MKSLPLKPNAKLEVLEADIEAYLVAEVNKLGGRSRKYTSPAFRSNPDRILMFEGGRIAFVECKRPGKKPTAKQASEIQRLRDEGFFADWVDSRESVDLVLNQVRWMLTGKTFFLRDLETGDYA